MWSNAEEQIPDIENELKTIIKRVEVIMNRDLKNRYRSIG